VLTVADRNPKLEGRTGELWRLYVSGWTQEAMAEKFGISQPRVSQILAAVRAQIPEVDRTELIRRELDFLDANRRMLTDLAVAPLPPAFDQKGGILWDPETKQMVRDATGRVAAIKAGLDVQQQMRKLLGLDQPLKVDATVTDAAAVKAAELAAEAAAYMASGEES
jgi:DNA-binding transcriptional regulator LsrR (DeoR family)